MTVHWPVAGRNNVVRGPFAAGLLAAALALQVGAGFAADVFPFDRDLLFDTVPVRPAKRVPILNVAADGAATIDLWCKIVRGFVQVIDNTIRIEPGPLPDWLPQYVTAGQCTPERMQADYEVLATLNQVTGWQRGGNKVILDGPARLRFRLSDH